MTNRHQATLPRLVLLWLREWYGELAETWHAEAGQYGGRPKLAIRRNVAGFETTIQRDGTEDINEGTNPSHI